MVVPRFRVVMPRFSVVPRFNVPSSLLTQKFNNVCLFNDRSHRYITHPAPIALLSSRSIAALLPSVFCVVMCACLCAWCAVCVDVLMCFGLALCESRSCSTAPVSYSGGSRRQTLPCPSARSSCTRPRSAPGRPSACSR